ncbi:hypothetical protein M422DRAFT_224696 [Sphaerobolus stellatus SS14]|nr:hypothetical protein M422DRAFT_224696 [Sphaerobolus stellatus SS14]
MAPIPSHSQIVVVGAGPVGLLTALRLARANVTVTVLEALPNIENSPRAAVYQPESVAELDRAGILETCRSIGFSSNTVAWRKITGEPIATIDREPGPDEYEVLVLGQHELAEVIFNELEEKHSSNARVLFGHRVVKLEQNDKEIKVKAHTIEGDKEFSADYVVGADGGKSSVRSLAGIELEGFTWPVQLIATNVVYPFEKYGYVTNNMICDPESFAVIAKLNKQDLFRVTYAEGEHLSFDEIKERLPMKYEQLFPGPRPLQYDIKMIAPYRTHQRCSKTFRKGRVILAGDAAHICTPFGGLGLTGGLLDAGALADCLIAIYHFSISDRILDIYSVVRRDIFKNIIDPATQNNITRLWKIKPDELIEKDEFIKRVKEAETNREKMNQMKGVPGIMVDMEHWIKELRREVENSKGLGVKENNGMEVKVKQGTESTDWTEGRI